MSLIYCLMESSKNYLKVLVLGKATTTICVKYFENVVSKMVLNSRDIFNLFGISSVAKKIIIF